MRKKYIYCVNDIETKRSDFIAELKKCCQSAIHVLGAAEWCNAEIIGFNKEMFKAELKSIESGMQIMIPDGYGSKVYKKFYRKEVR